MMQIVDSGGNRYSFARDIINLFPHLIVGSSRGAQLTTMPQSIRDFATYTGVTDADTVKAFAAIQRFIDIIRQPQFGGEHGLMAAYMQSGMDKIPQAVAVAFYSVLGMSVTKAYFHHLRDSLPVAAPTPGSDYTNDILERTIHAYMTSDPAAQSRRLAGVDDVIADKKENPS